MDNVNLAEILVKMQDGQSGNSEVSEFAEKW